MKEIKADGIGEIIPGPTFKWGKYPNVNSLSVGLIEKGYSACRVLSEYQDFEERQWRLHFRGIQIYRLVLAYCFTELLKDKAKGGADEQG